MFTSERRSSGRPFDGLQKNQTLLFIVRFILSHGHTFYYFVFFLRMDGRTHGRTGGRTDGWMKTYSSWFTVDWTKVSDRCRYIMAARLKVLPQQLTIDCGPSGFQFLMCHDFRTLTHPHTDTLAHTRTLPPSLLCVSISFHSLHFLPFSFLLCVLCRPLLNRNLRRILFGSAIDKLIGPRM